MICVLFYIKKGKKYMNNHVFHYYYYYFRKILFWTPTCFPQTSKFLILDY